MTRKKYTERQQQTTAENVEQAYLKCEHTAGLKIRHGHIYLTLNAETLRLAGISILAGE